MRKYSPFRTCIDRGTSDKRVDPIQVAVRWMLKHIICLNWSFLSSVRTLVVGSFEFQWFSQPIPGALWPNFKKWVMSMFNPENVHHSNFLAYFSMCTISLYQVSTQTPVLPISPSTSHAHARASWRLSSGRITFQALLETENPFRVISFKATHGRLVYQGSSAMPRWVPVSRIAAHSSPVESGGATQHVPTTSEWALGSWWEGNLDCKRNPLDLETIHPFRVDVFLCIGWVNESSRRTMWRESRSRCWYLSHR